MIFMCHKRIENFNLIHIACFTSSAFELHVRLYSNQILCIREASC
jgi:hypothetical protein